VNLPNIEGYQLSLFEKAEGILSSSQNQADRHRRSFSLSGKSKPNPAYSSVLSPKPLAREISIGNKINGTF
jgi:hypothetical protein